MNLEESTTAALPLSPTWAKIKLSTRPVRTRLVSYTLQWDCSRKNLIFTLDSAYSGGYLMHRPHVGRLFLTKSRYTGSD